MTNDILQIPQIPSVAPEHLQNDYHIGFTGDIADRTYIHRVAPGEKYSFLYSITIL